MNLNVKVNMQTWQYSGSHSVRIKIMAPPPSIKYDGCLAFGRNHICLAFTTHSAATGHLFENNGTRTFPVFSLASNS